MITADQVRQVTFVTTQFAEAYLKEPVDGLLAQVARTLDALESGRTTGAGGSALLLPRDVRGVVLPSSRLEEGYLRTDVEAFRELVATTLEEYVRRYSAPATAPLPGAAAPRPAVVPPPAAPATRAHRAVADPAPAATATPRALGAVAVAAPGTPLSAASAGGRTGSASAPDPAHGTPPAAAIDLTDAPAGLGAYDLLVHVQRARSTLFGTARDELVVTHPDGRTLRVTGVETVPGGVVVHVR